MRYLLLIVILAAIVTGCAHGARNPAVPGLPGDEPLGIATTERCADIYDGPHRLWGEWTFYFNADHNRVDAVPRRQGRFHLNSLKFLEEYCTDCLEITRIRNNGDGTIDLTVKITHPFPGRPEYTGFDVKGIIMFASSYELQWGSSEVWPFSEPFRLSWCEAGDPEVLNQDGYCPRWSPWWDSGSSMPIFNYWPGKYSSGTPTANLNAFLNFYTHEERHMFRADGQVQRTYHISLPPGPVVAGYAIEACWEPPTVTPVTDPLYDFPITANQPEPYHFRLVVNNDEPITFEPCCSDGGGVEPCELAWTATRQWYGDKLEVLVHTLPPPRDRLRTNAPLWDCPWSPPDEHRQRVAYMFLTAYFGDGVYRGVALALTSDPRHDPKLYNYVYDVLDFEIDLE